MTDVGTVGRLLSASTYFAVPKNDARTAVAGLLVATLVFLESEALSKLRRKSPLQWCVPPTSGVMNTPFSRVEQGAVILSALPSNPRPSAAPGNHEYGDASNRDQRHVVIVPAEDELVTHFPEQQPVHRHGPGHLAPVDRHPESGAPSSNASSAESCITLPLSTILSLLLLHATMRTSAVASRRALENAIGGCPSEFIVECAIARDGPDGGTNPKLVIARLRSYDVKPLIVVPIRLR